MTCTFRISCGAAGSQGQSFDLKSVNGDAARCAVTGHSKRGWIRIVARRRSA